MEGLRAIQIYGDESDNNNPRREVLHYWLKEGVDRLRECVTSYPEDFLPRYNLGVALTTCNQYLYVQRLFALKGSFVALGRVVRLQEKIGEHEEQWAELRETAMELIETQLEQAVDEGTQLVSDATEIQEETNQLRKQLEASQESAQDAIDLDKEPWPLLHDAATHFEYLLGLLNQPRNLNDVACRSLIRSTTYNLAEVYARLGRVDGVRDDIRDAKKYLAGMQEPILLKAHWYEWQTSSENEEHASAIQLTEWESIALDLQVEILATALQARHVLKELRQQTEEELSFQTSVADLEIYMEKMRQLESEINNSKLPPRFMVEVKADYWIKRGYLTYEQALTPFGGLGASCKKMLEDATDSLNNALRLKPNWNPAQIYQALVFAVRSGVADADGETKQRDRFSRDADALFNSLLGSSVTPSVSPAAAWNLHVEGTLQASPETAKPKAEAGQEPAQR